MASEQKKGYRKLSGILKSRTFDSGLDHRDNRGVKIYIKNQYGNNGSLPPEIEKLFKFKVVKIRSAQQESDFELKLLEIFGEHNPSFYSSKFQKYIFVDEEQFEHLKDMYYKQCQPINANLIRKLTEKRTASNYKMNFCTGKRPLNVEDNLWRSGYYDSAQCSRVIPPRIDSAHHNVVSSMARPSRRDVAVNPRDQKNSGNGRSGAVKKPDTNTRNHSCAKCHRRHY